MIPDAQVEEVRARADLVDVIGELVPLKKAGKEFKANCPFHDERTPSFYVVPAKGFYKCFGCGESGDVFSFVMKRLGMDFVDAVKYVAARSGVEIREVSRGGAPEEDPFRAHYEANAFARDFFRRTLLDPELGADARDYLSHRGIDQATAERFGVGYAPDDWRALRDAAAKHGMSDTLLLEVGLLTSSERAPEPYDRFRHRIMFPIEDPGGRVVAFGGRILGSGSVPRGTGKEPAKYVNTAETPIYHKGQVLYGLAWAKNAIRRDGAALVVEGYMDAVSLAAAGFENVVAPLGTSFTDAQAGLLARYTKRVLLLFDSDEAGLKATFRGGDVLLAHALHPAVVTLPAGEDPDTLVRKEGAAGLRHYLDQAVDVLERKLQMLREHGYFESIDKTRRALDKLLPTVRAAVDPTLRDLYVSRVAEATGVRRETLEAELGRPSATRAPERRAEAPVQERRRTRGSSPILEMGPDRDLMRCLVQMPDWVPEAAERLGPTVFRDEVDRAIFERLLSDPTLADVEGLAPSAVERLARLRDPARGPVVTRVLFDSSMAELLQRLTQEERAELTQRFHESASDEERKSIERQLRALQGAGPERPRGSDARKVYTLANPSMKTTG